MEKDFQVRKFYTYSGPSFYLNRKAVVFNLFLDPEGASVGVYEDVVFQNLPALAEMDPATNLAEFFAMTVMQVMKMDIDLFVNAWSVDKDDEEWVIAVEYLDDIIAEECVYLVCDWFKAIDANEEYPFMEKWEALQKKFDRTLYGGPTIYSLYEGGVKRAIPVNYLLEENQLQWGYGKKQIRGRSTTFHVDGIKDTEFTMFKDMCGDFLEMCGLPTPAGTNCFEEDEAVEAAVKLGYPVVVKPVAGHKGQGVVTGIVDEAGVRKAYQNIIKMATEQGVNFDGALVQRMIYGTDHRLLAVGGKFAAALERVAAYVDGDGTHTIQELIDIENDTIVRLDNARSPLCKIKPDQDLIDYLAIQKLKLDDVIPAGERVILRRVANISAGGVSINVTDNMHPLNVKLVEDIAGFFNVTCLGIDVLSADISKPWMEGNFGIIEINAGPGVFMHLAPAIGSSVDVPGIIMAHHFYRPEYSRIPIIAGNKLSAELADKIYEAALTVKSDVHVGSYTPEGIHFDGKYFHNHPEHDQNIKIVLRNPKLDLAIFNHTKDDIFDFGTWHEGMDILVLEGPHYAEEILKRDVMPGGYIFEVDDEEIIIQKGEEMVKTAVPEDSDKYTVLLSLITPLLAELLAKYE